MKISTLLANLDTSESNQDWVDVCGLAQNHFDLYHLPYTDEHDIKCYWIGSHICTDTQVGYRAYFLQGQLFAVSVQTDRKSDEEFNWVSVVDFNKVHQYLLTLAETPEINILDFNEEVSDTYDLGNVPTHWNLKG